MPASLSLRGELIVTRDSWGLMDRTAPVVTGEGPGWNSLMVVFPIANEGPSSPRGQRLSEVITYDYTNEIKRGDTD